LFLPEAKTLIISKAKKAKKPFNKKALEDALFHFLTSSLNTLENQSTLVTRR